MVVGGGTAGAIVAARVAAHGDRSVVLLEAGPDFPGPDETPPVLLYGDYAEGRVTTRDFAWAWDTVPSAPGAAPYVLYSGKVIGGGSSVNGQVWLHGLPGDFDGNWAARGASGWGWREVAPWYAAVARDLDFPARGGSGPVPVRRVPPAQWHPVHAGFLDACLDAGFPHCPDLNAPGASGVGPHPLNNLDGVRVSSALSHLRSARDLPTLRVLGDRDVERVLFDGDRAVGVLARTPAGAPVRVLAEQEVVLAAGGVATPWLLLRSGVGDADHLRRNGVPVVLDSAGVGASLREHPRVMVRWRARPGYELNATSVRAPVALRTTAPGSAIPDDLKLSIAAFEDEQGAGIEMTIFLMLAVGSGHVRLAEGEPAARPVVDPRFLREPEDVRRLREAVRFAVDLVESSPALREVVAERVAPAGAIDDDAVLDGWLRRAVRGTFHASSTCAIGPPGSGAVVDQVGRVLGVRGLRVVDASVMPDSVRANINATVAMMAERFAAAIITQSALTG
ncbi:GMC family oxidoreductase [Pseudonocardia zijingensis]|uniref:GMC family oxidoreductase N-terminal domain-containing protein n=1 Tax=Pseudonocardia zijingensis TaxID=153376 RepID=A0ABP4AFE3_9PSEU